MSLPYIKCPKCHQRSSPSDYWTCPNCSYSESRECVLLEENKDYEEEREKRIEVRDEELRKWEEEQEKLCRKVIHHLLPNQKVEVRFMDYLPNDNWGQASYRENNLVKAHQAKQRFTEKERLGFFGVNNLIIYNQEPSVIIISRQALKVKEVASPTGLAGFLPTSSHESAHVSPEVNHDPLYKPWVNRGHDEVWRKISERFLDKAKIKFGKEVDERFKQLEEIKKEN